MNLLRCSWMTRVSSSLPRFFRRTKNSRKKRRKTHDFPKCINGFPGFFPDFVSTYKIYLVALPICFPVQTGRPGFCWEAFRQGPHGVIGSQGVAGSIDLFTTFWFWELLHADDFLVERVETSTSYNLHPGRSTLILADSVAKLDSVPLLLLFTSQRIYSRSN